ncbi:hypothetical protein RNZ50_24770 [Paracoccaceae bacterium Fryx2]|nr:hypothetical protein [Paracoccaceae bacterium Fryx2]
MSNGKLVWIHGLPGGDFRWLASGAVASTNWIWWIWQKIQHGKIVIQQAFDNESLFKIKQQVDSAWLPR